MEATPLSGALDALSKFLVADASLGDTLERVAAITVDAMPAAEFAGVAMFDEQGRVTTGVFTDPKSPKIDEAQFESGRGPCLDAWRERRIVRMDDMGTDANGRYPEFTAACKEHGIQSTLSLPMVAADQGIGALNLYSSTSHGFTDDDAAVGEDLATAASVVLANAVAYWGAYELSQQMSEAMRSRAIIEQAKGMLMAQSSDMTADDAFELLRKASQRENVKLRDIAQRIVERRAPASS